MDSAHVVLFPFMSKGHTIPILHLARLLLSRSITVTIFTTPSNRPFIFHSLSDTTASTIDLPFPSSTADGSIPDGVESTDELPSMSLFASFGKATKLMQPHFERELQILPRVSFMVSDGFLPWTLQSATKFGIPRFVFYGMNNYAMVLTREIAVDKLQLEPESDDELFAVPTFPWIKLTRNDLEPTFREAKPQGAHFDFVMEVAVATLNSHGLVVNSFCELESVFLDHWNRELKPKAWCVGPLCLAEPPKVIPKTTMWMQWLDEKLVQGRSVLYVAFGSQAEISPDQFKEIATGLEESGVSFLWVVRKKGLSKFDYSFEERVKERGLVVREWVDQTAILNHECVKGFMSHCGWNSVLESICASVPILAWPMMAEQHLNARMVVEEIKVGLRVETVNGSVRGFVTWEGLKKMVRELMEGEKGKEVRRKVEEVGWAARKAVKEGGSSWHTLNQLIDETNKDRSGPRRDFPYLFLDDI